MSLFSTNYKYIFSVMSYVVYYFCCWCYDDVSSCYPNSNSISQFSWCVCRSLYGTNICIKM